MWVRKKKKKKKKSKDRKRISVPRRQGSKASVEAGGAIGNTIEQSLTHTHARVEKKGERTKFLQEMHTHVSDTASS